MNKELVEKAYAIAREQYAGLGIDTEKALEKLNEIKISLHCWQADDVAGFERPDAELGGGGIQVTGNYPWKARNMAQLRQDIEKVLTLVPGRHRININTI